MKKKLEQYEHTEDVYPGMTRRDKTTKQHRQNFKNYKLDLIFASLFILVSAILSSTSAQIPKKKKPPLVAQSFNSAKKSVFRKNQQKAHLINKIKKCEQDLSLKQINPQHESLYYSCKALFKADPVITSKVSRLAVQYSKAHYLYAYAYSKELPFLSIKLIDKGLLATNYCLKNSCNTIKKRMLRLKQIFQLTL